MVPTTRYGWKDNHDTFALVTEAGDPDSYMEVIEIDDYDKWITALE